MCLSYSHLWVTLVVVRSLLTSLFRFDRFNAFETSLRDIDGLLQNWDRTTGTVVRADTPKSENFDDTLPAPGSTRRTRDKKDKEKELREREKEREKEKAKEVGGLSQYMPSVNNKTLLSVKQCSLGETHTNKGTQTNTKHKTEKTKISTLKLPFKCQG